jgi:hypothetical protein
MALNTTFEEQVQIYRSATKREQQKFLKEIKNSLMGQQQPTGHQHPGSEITIGDNQKLLLLNLQQMLQQDTADGGHKSILTASVSMQRFPCPLSLSNSS